MTLSLSVRPRMNASGITSITSLTMNRLTCSKSIMSCRASNSGRRYGLTLACRSPGRKPSRSPASTAGRASTIRLACPCFSMLAAAATARYVLPVPAGPTQNVRSLREHRLDVPLLALGLGLDRVALGVDVDLVGRPLALARRPPCRSPGRRPRRSASPAGGASSASGRARRRPWRPARVAGEAQLVVAADELHAERVADHPQVPVGRPEQGQLLVRLFEGDAEVHNRNAAMRRGASPPGLRRGTPSTGPILLPLEAEKSRIVRSRGRCKGKSCAGRTRYS